MFLIGLNSLIRALSNSIQSHSGYQPCAYWPSFTYMLTAILCQLYKCILLPAGEYKYIRKSGWTARALPLVLACICSPASQQDLRRDFCGIHVGFLWFIVSFLVLLLRYSTFGSILRLNWFRKRGRYCYFARYRCYSGIKGVISVYKYAASCPP